MNNDREKISAYLDEGLSPKELESLRSLDSDSGADVAARYQLMGEAMRGHVSDASMTNISAQVSAAIRNEDSQEAERTASASVKQPRQPLFDISAWFRPIGGLAVAASVALVMVVSFTQVDSPDGGVGQVADNSTVNIPDNVPAPVVVAVEKTSSEQQQAVNLDEYLAEHAEVAAQDTLQGRMPYARAVSYESR